jgi:hypothetical protein
MSLCIWGLRYSCDTPEQPKLNLLGLCETTWRCCLAVVFLVWHVLIPFLETGVLQCMGADMVFIGHCKTGGVRHFEGPPRTATCSRECGTFAGAQYVCALAAGSRVFSSAFLVFTHILDAFSITMFSLTQDKEKFKSFVSHCWPVSSLSLVISQNNKPSLPWKIGACMQCATVLLIPFLPSSARLLVLTLCNCSLGFFPRSTTARQALLCTCKHRKNVFCGSECYGYNRQEQQLQSPIRITSSREVC